MYESNPGAVKAEQLQFVPISKGHIPELLGVEQEAYPDPWTQGMFLQEVRNGTSHFFLAFRGETLIAYGGFWLILDEIHITKLTVARPYRGAGLGSVVLQYLEARGRAAGGTVMRLEVRESNRVARHLYQQAGFEELGRRKGYYSATGEDAVVMVKEFSSPSA